MKFFKLVPLEWVTPEMLEAARTTPTSLVMLDSISAREDLMNSERYKAMVNAAPTVTEETVRQWLSQPPASLSVEAAAGLLSMLSGEPQRELSNDLWVHEICCYLGWGTRGYEREGKVIDECVRTDDGYIGINEVLAIRDAVIYIMRGGRCSGALKRERGEPNADA